MTKATVRIVFVGLTVLGLLLAGATSASAHALLKRSDPAAGAELAKSPENMLLTFTEPPDPTLSSVMLLDSSGSTVHTQPASAVDGSPLELRLALPNLGNGIYTVNWRTVSKADGHVTGGSFSFGIGVAPAAGTSSRQAVSGGAAVPSPLAVAGRWAFYIGLSVLLSAAVARLLVFRREIPRIRGLLVIAWFAAAAGLIGMIFAERAAVGFPLGTLLASPTGHGYVWQAIMLGLTGILVAIADTRAAPVTIALVASGAAVVLAFHAFAGHAGAGGAWRLANVADQWLHLLAVGIWIGGLVWLFAGTRPLATGEGDIEELYGAVRRFSAIAAVALGVVAVTGLLRAVDLIGGWGEWRRLVTTSWGNALGVKLILFGGLVVLGAMNRFVNVPGLGSGRGRALRRAVAGELVLAAGIFGVTGVLTGLSPPALEPKVPPPALVTVTGSDFATSVRTRLTASPGLPGSNRFAATVMNYGTTTPAQTDRVALRFSLPSNPDLGTSTLELERDGNSATWSGEGTQMSIAGRWDVTVLVQGGTNAVEVPLQLQTRAPPQKVSIARAPGQPDLYTITTANGNAVQAYLDPGAPGPSNLHLTAFDPDGRELPLGPATISATAPDGSTRTLIARRFSAGHFVADVTLLPGRWSFTLVAPIKAGGTMQVSFTQAIS